MSDKLLPCPFCGEKSIAWEPPGDDGKVKYVFCANSVSCGAELSLHEPGQDAIAAWNTRSPSPTIAEPNGPQQSPINVNIEDVALGFDMAVAAIEGWDYGNDAIEAVPQTAHDLRRNRATILAALSSSPPLSENG